MYVHFLGSPSPAKWSVTILVMPKSNGLKEEKLLVKKKINRSTLFNSFYSRSLTKYKVAEKTYSSPPLGRVHIKVLKAIRWGKMISEVRCTYFMCTCVFKKYILKFMSYIYFLTAAEYFVDKVSWVSFS